MSETTELTWHAVGRVGDIAEGTARRLDIDGVDVALIRSCEGIFAIDDICSHAEVSLSEGDVEGCFIECWLHGSRFDIRTGDPTGPPAVDPVPVYSVRVEGEGDDATIYVAVTEGAGHTWQS